MRYPIGVFLGQQSVMNSDTLSQSLQKGFRVTLGATASLIEAIQDPQQSRQTFSGLGNDVNRLTEELEIKGEVTEREARQFVDGLMRQMPDLFQGTDLFQTDGSSAPPTVNTVATPVVDLSIQTELEALTQELAQVRQDIETLKTGDSGR
jgi:polyhydroxyalkanoate synthesis regulator phasin